MKINFIDINYYNGFGRWYGKDRLTFPETEINPEKLESIRETQYYSIKPGFSEYPYLDEDNQVERQVKCIEYSSVYEVLEEIIKRFS